MSKTEGKVVREAPIEARIALGEGEFEVITDAVDTIRESLPEDCSVYVEHLTPGGSIGF